MARLEVEDAPARIAEIVRAIQILTHSPLIGRPVRGGPPWAPNDRLVAEERAILH